MGTTSPPPSYSLFPFLLSNLRSIFRTGLGKEEERDGLNDWLSSGTTPLQTKYKTLVRPTIRLLSSLSYSFLYLSNRSFENLKIDFLSPSKLHDTPSRPLSISTRMGFVNFQPFGQKLTVKWSLWLNRLPMFE